MTVRLGCSIRAKRRLLWGKLDITMSLSCSIIMEFELLINEMTVFPDCA